MTIKLSMEKTYDRLNGLLQRIIYHIMLFVINRSIRLWNA